MKVADEFGKVWMVYEGDIAYGLCRPLIRAGIKQLVLPRDALLRGQVPTTDYPKIQATAAVIRTFPEVKEAVQRRIRLMDCVEFLRRLENQIEQPDGTHR